jgi:hypothetical protein
MGVTNRNAIWLRAGRKSHAVDGDAAPRRKILRAWTRREAQPLTRSAEKIT